MERAEMDFQSQKRMLGLNFQEERRDLVDSYSEEKKKLKVELQEDIDKLKCVIGMNLKEHQKEMNELRETHEFGVLEIIVFIEF